MSLSKNLKYHYHNWLFTPVTWSHMYPFSTCACLFSLLYVGLFWCFSLNHSPLSSLCGPSRATSMTFFYYKNWPPLCLWIYTAWVIIFMSFSIKWLCCSWLHKVYLCVCACVCTQRGTPCETPWTQRLLSLLGFFVEQNIQAWQTFMITWTLNMAPCFLEN